MAVPKRDHHSDTEITCHMESQCYLPPGSSDFPVFTPAKAGTRFSEPGGMQS